jgi:hypothetical protein
VRGRRTEIVPVLDATLEREPIVPLLIADAGAAARSALTLIYVYRAVREWRAKIVPVLDATLEREPIVPLRIADAGAAARSALTLIYVYRAVRGWRTEIVPVLDATLEREPIVPLPLAGVGEAQLDVPYGQGHPALDRFHARTHDLLRKDFAGLHFALDERRDAIGAEIVPTRGEAGALSRLVVAKADWACDRLLWAGPLV